MDFGLIPGLAQNIVFEEKGNGPQSAQSNHGEDNPGHDRKLSAKQRRNQVKTEKTNASPVQGTNDDKN